jgi:hypothetical protein
VQWLLFAAAHTARHRAQRIGWSRKLWMATSRQAELAAARFRAFIGRRGFLGRRSCGRQREQAPSAHEEALAHDPAATPIS